MRARLGVGFLCFLSVLIGCSPAQPQQPDDVATTVAEAPKGGEGVEPLTPVPAPSDLFLLARLKSPEQSIERLAAWIHFPIPWREALEREMPALSSQIDASAPVDVAVTLDPGAAGVPEPLFAFSVGLKDVASTVDALRAAGRQVEKLGTGMHFVKIEEDVRCAVSRANGAAPGRLVCSETRKALDSLAPYMARTLTTEVLSNEDLYMVFRAEPLRRRFGKKAHMIKVGVPLFLREVSLGNARFDGAVADAAHAVADETLALIEEANEIRVSSSLDPSTDSAVTRFEFELAGGRSFTSGVVSEQAQQGKPAPEMFWSLPKDVTSASYGSSMPVERYRPIVSTLAELGLGAAEHYAVKTPALEAWLEAYKGLLAAPVTSVYATGATATKEAKPGAKPSPSAAFAALIGYHLVGVEGDGGRFQELVDLTVKLFNDPKVRKLAEQKVDEKLRHLPQVKKVAATGMPKGSVVYDFKLTPKDWKKIATGGEPLDQTVTLQLWAVPVGERTWFVLAPGEEARAVMKKVLSTTPGETLAGRPGLESFRSTPAASAGFLTLSEYTRSLDAMAVAEPDSKLKARDVLLAMPSHGQTPIVFRSRAVASGPTWVLELVAPKAALEDATAAIVSLAAQSGSF